MPFCHRAASLNEGRGVNPGDTIGAGMVRVGHSALNEGRGVNPGDTVERGHGLVDDTVLRSTKAGA